MSVCTGPFSYDGTNYTTITPTSLATPITSHQRFSKVGVSNHRIDVWQGALYEAYFASLIAALAMKSSYFRLKYPRIFWMPFMPDGNMVL